MKTARFFSIGILGFLFAATQTFASGSPDFDGDGWVGQSDLLDFVHAFGVRSQDADMDGDGNFGMADFLQFADAYGKAVDLPDAPLHGQPDAAWRRIRRVF